MTNFTNRLTDQAEAKTEVRNTPPKERPYADGVTFFINGKRCLNDDHSFNFAIHKDVAEVKYKQLIEDEVLFSFVEDEYRDFVSCTWDEDEVDEYLAEIPDRKNYYWYEGSTIHQVDENDEYVDTLEDEDIFAWLGIDPADADNDYYDVGNG